jgi:hypothetical protein
MNSIALLYFHFKIHSFRDDSIAAMPKLKSEEKK